jgi:hypothetical protein
LATMLLALGTFLLPFVHMGWGWGHEIGETLSHVLGFICVATEDGIMWNFGLWYVLLLLFLFTLLLGCFFFFEYIPHLQSAWSITILMYRNLDLSHAMPCHDCKKLIGESEYRT